MGAYLSEPVTEKMSSDESNAKLECGASSMQGWRVNQEDAHNTILDYDADTSFFAVYDGHGGAEVATYCSQNLPEYIKKTDAYKNGDLVNALTDAFLGFDATIVTKEVMDILKELAGEINPPGTSDIEESEDENVSNLYQEAHLPLQEVLAKYENKLTALHRARLGDTNTPLSPCLRAKKNTEESGASAASSSSSGHAAGSSLEQTCDAPSSSKNGVTDDVKENAEEDSGGVSSTNSNEVDKDLNGEVSTSEPEKVVKENVNKPILPAPDSSEDNCQPEQSENVKSSTNGCNVVTTENCNGEVTGSKQIDGEDSNITSSNGSVTPVKTGKANDKTSPVSSSGKEVPERPKKSKLRRAAAAVYESILRQVPEEDDDESDSNDETFEGGEICSSDDDNVNGVEESSEECEEEEDEEDYEAESSDEEGDEDINMAEEPGNDSGCTAIVALLRGNELYVANAGDSRCIICREGKAIDMSIDHKPEDAPELDRIIKAGGKVSYDGRINGGLNLSRAIGDHSYKQNKELDAKEQMVTALPDVKTLTVDPAKDQFMVLACDGIWNFMSSQDVCDFITPRLAEGRERLSQICEEMFDHCLAPTTMGDGTGCDNMTAIIVRFKDGLIADVGQHSSTTECPKKRTADCEPCNENQQDNKRQKLDDSLSSSVVTSSV
ncbi:PREDICTED: probable protein phosphatase CG10417 isoform X1 [Papilio xuthus]|uniref:protein-serine/threonine phosphatase n=1 Tax=Papilio xuthus TaxID=66420 RepID=A0AAJ7EK91_PAPXU|nr:PREDICTED: probable protein phosphatase CG10417 isoform X1 [Papilio xuthus]